MSHFVAEVEPIDSETIEEPTDEPVSWPESPAPPVEREASPDIDTEAVTAEMQSGQTRLQEMLETKNLEIVATPLLFEVVARANGTNVYRDTKGLEKPFTSQNDQEFTPNTQTTVEVHDKGKDHGGSVTVFLGKYEENGNTVYRYLSATFRGTDTQNQEDLDLDDIGVAPLSIVPPDVSLSFGAQSHTHHPLNDSPIHQDSHATVEIGTAKVTDFTQPTAVMPSSELTTSVSATDIVLDFKTIAPTTEDEPIFERSGEVKAGPSSEAKGVPISSAELATNERDTKSITVKSVSKPEIAQQHRVIPESVFETPIVLQQVEHTTIADHTVAIETASVRASEVVNVETVSAPPEIKALSFPDDVRINVVKAPQTTITAIYQPVEYQSSPEPVQFHPPGDQIESHTEPVRESAVEGTKPEPAQNLPRDRRYPKMTAEQVTIPQSDETSTTILDPSPEPVQFHPPGDQIERRIEKAMSSVEVKIITPQQPLSTVEKTALPADELPLSESLAQRLHEISQRRPLAEYALTIPVPIQEGPYSPPPTEQESFQDFFPETIAVLDDFQPEIIKTPLSDSLQRLEDAAVGTTIKIIGESDHVLDTTTLTKTETGITYTFREENFDTVSPSRDIFLPTNEGSVIQHQPSIRPEQSTVASEPITITLDEVLFNDASLTRDFEQLVVSREPTVKIRVAPHSDKEVPSHQTPAAPADVPTARSDFEPIEESKAETTLNVAKTEVPSVNPPAPLGAKRFTGLRPARLPEGQAGLPARPADSPTLEKRVKPSEWVPDTTPTLIQQKPDVLTIPEPLLTEQQLQHHRIQWFSSTLPPDSKRQSPPSSPSKVKTSVRSS